MSTATVVEVDPALEEAIRDALDDALCVEADCEQLAIVRATALPCGHQGGYCAAHRRYVTRAMDWHRKAGTAPPCGVCRTPITDVRWERP